MNVSYSEDEADFEGECDGNLSNASIELGCSPVVTTSDA